jgi:hypothetical protein
MERWQTVRRVRGKKKTLNMHNVNKDTVWGIQILIPPNQVMFAFLYKQPTRCNNNISY